MLYYHQPCFFLAAFTIKMKTVKNMKQSRFILFVLSFLMMSIGNVYAQNIIVTGTVLDSTGEPVIGANVKVAGNSSVGTITDF